MKKVTSKETKWHFILRSCLCMVLMCALTFGKVVPLSAVKAAGEATENTLDPNDPTQWEPDLYREDFNGFTDVSAAFDKLEDGNYNPTTSSIKQKLVSDPENTGNQYMQLDLDKSNSNRGFDKLFDVSNTKISDANLAGKSIVYEYKIAKVKDKDIPDGMALFYNVQVAVDSNVIQHPVKIAANGRVYFELDQKEDFTAQVTENGWTIISAAVKYSAEGAVESCVYYVNNAQYDNSDSKENTSENIKKPSGIRILKGTAAGSFLIDDVRVYVGEVPHVSGTKAAGSEQPTEPPTEAPTEEPTESPEQPENPEEPEDPSQYEEDLLNIDFSQAWEVFGPQIGLGESNTNTAIFNLNTDSQYLEVTAGATRTYLDCFRTIANDLALADSGKEIVYEYTVAIPSANALENLDKVVLFYGYTSTVRNQFSVLDGKLAPRGDKVLNDAMGEIPAGEWTKFSLVVDYSTKKNITVSGNACDGYDYKLYINDVCVKEYGSTLIVGKDGAGLKYASNNNNYPAYADIIQPRGICFAAGGSGTLFIDNIRVYKGSEPHVPGTESQSGTGIYVDRTFDEAYKYDMEELDLTGNGGSVELTGTTNKYLELSAATASAKVTYLIGSGSTYVVAQTKLSLENTATGSVFTGVASDGKTFSFLNVTDGAVVLPDGTKIADLAAGSWVDVAVAVKMNTMTYKVYLGTEVVKDDIPVSEITDLASISTVVSAGTLLMDNVRVYDEKDIKTQWVTNDNPDYIYLPDSYAENLLGSAIALQINAHTFYANGVKGFASKEYDLSESGKVYVALADIKALFGNNVVLTGITEKSGAYDVYAVAQANGYKVVAGLSDRLIVFDKSGAAAKGWTTDESKEVNKYLQFDRPEGDELVELYEEFKVKNGGAHPSVLLTAADVERIQNLYNSGETYVKQWGDQAIASANSALNAADYTFKVGSGGGIDDAGSSVTRMINLGMAYFLSNDETAKANYFAKAKKMMDIICGLKDWNPSPEGSYLDTSEICFALAIGYDWFYDLLTEQERAVIEKNMLDKGVGIHAKIFYGVLDPDKVYWTWWEGAHNMNSVMNGGMMASAIALMDKYPEFCGNMIANAMHSLEFLMDAFYPEGVWKEGGNYWSYTMHYFSYNMQTLTNVMGDDFGFICSPGLENTGWYALNLAGATNNNNFGDTTSGFTNCYGVMWCAKTFRDEELMAVRLLELEKRGWSGGARSIIFYDETLVGDTEVKLPLDTETTDMNIVGLRQKWFDANATYLGFAGTKDKNNHAHIDGGSFVVDMLGERLFCEVGADQYDKYGYFHGSESAGNNRWRYYATRPEGHNLYIINPTDVATELDFGGITPWKAMTNTPVVSKDTGAYVTLDMSATYNQYTSSAIRGFMLLDDRRNVLIRDEINLDYANPSDIYSYLHTKADIAFDEEDPNTAILTLNGKKYRVVIHVDGDAIESYTFKAVAAQARVQHVGSNGTLIQDKDNSTNGISKLEIHVKTTGAGMVNITMKVMAYDDPAANDPLITIPISQWSADMIPDGEVRELPTLDMIYVNGQPMEGFDPDLTGYTTQLEAGATLPEITATTSADNKIEITPATDFGKDYEIKVYNSKNSSLYQVYRVSYSKVKGLLPVDGRVRYPVANATESGIDKTISGGVQVNGGAINTVDNDFNTSRWGMLGKKDSPQWMMLELEEVSTVHKIGIAFTYGVRRHMVFKLEVSVDGENWTTVFDGESPELVNSIQYFYDSEEGIAAKYVRYSGPGGRVPGETTVKNYWHHITEFVVLGPENVTESYDLELGGSIEILHSDTAENLESIKLNGEVISAENYTVADGNAGVITLKAGYLKTLQAGTYSVTVNYKEGDPVVMTLDVLSPGSTNVQIIPEGTIGSYTTYSGEAVSIHADGNRSDLVGVMLNGQMVNSGNYEVKEGSTIVTFKNAYLDQLAAGTYKVTLLYSVGRSAESSLVIVEGEKSTDGAGETTGTEDETTGAAEETTGTVDESDAPGTDAAPGGDPGTGDMNRASSWLWLFMAAMIVMTGCATFRFEKRKQK